MHELTTSVLMGIWERTIGKAPPAAQFEIWSVMHTPEVIKESILVTARKNLQLGGNMTEEHRGRFASGVMRTRTIRNAQNAANRGH
jgi:hypothetical protein